jgi:Mg2+ and Co2+ transporter CorA
MMSTDRFGGSRHRAFALRDRAILACEAHELTRIVSDPESFVWIDLEASSIDTLNQTLLELGVDLVIEQDMDEAAVLPRLLDHARCMVCCVHEVSDPERHLHVSNRLGLMSPSQLILVLGERFVVTYHRSPMPCIDYVKTRSEAVFEFEGTGPSLIAYLLFQRCVYEYAHLNLANDNYLDRLQAGLRAKDFEALADIIEIAHANILTLKKMVSSLQIVLGRLTTMQTPFVDEEFISSTRTATSYESWSLTKSGI